MKIICKANRLKKTIPQTLKISKILLLSLLLGFLISAKASDTLCKGKFNKENQKDGVWWCTINNKKYKKERYKKGKLITYILYNEKGLIIETRNRKGKISKFNPCGC